MANKPMSGSGDMGATMSPMREPQPREIREGIMGKLQDWWAYNPEAELQSADNPHAPIRADQRRESLPLLTMAFGWGFLITGLLIGGSLGNGLPFEQIVQVTLMGNIVNFIIGALVGYVGYKTACNSGLLYKLVYGLSLIHI